MTAWLAGLSLAAAIASCGRRRPGTRLVGWRSEREPELRDAAPSGRRPTWRVAAVAGAVLVAAKVPPMLVVGLAGATAIGWRARIATQAARARDRCAVATVEITFALAGELRAGRTPAQALSAVAAVAGPLRPAVEAAGVAVAVGASAADELARAAELPGAERLRYVAAAWAVAESAGGRVAVVLERLSDAMDSDEELRQELDAAMAGPRATMVLLAGLPALGLVLGQGVGAHPLQLLLHRPLGWALLAAAGFLDALGVVVTRLIARSAMRP
jgi:tight adherence protein B